MSIRLVVSDVDGTLVQPDKSLSPGTIAAARRLAEAGIPLAIVSARPPRGMLWLAEALALKGAVAGFNGGAVVAPDGTMEEWLPVPAEQVRQAMALFDRRGVDTWLFTATEWLVRDPAAPHVEHEHQTVRFPPRVVGDFTPFADQVGKLCGVSPDPVLLEQVERELQAMVGENASARRSQTYYLDLTHKLANKGHAVEALAKRFGVKLEEVAVLGDMVNDLPMFRVAGLSVAMGNASAEVKRQATVATGPNGAEGWAQAVDTIILPKAAA